MRRHLSKAEHVVQVENVTVVANILLSALVHTGSLYQVPVRQQFVGGFLDSDNQSYFESWTGCLLPLVSSNSCTGNEQVMNRGQSPAVAADWQITIFGSTSSRMVEIARHPMDCSSLLALDVKIWQLRPILYFQSRFQ